MVLDGAVIPGPRFVQHWYVGGSGEGVRVGFSQGVENRVLGGTDCAPDRGFRTVRVLYQQVAGADQIFPVHGWARSRVGKINWT